MSPGEFSKALSDDRIHPGDPQGGNIQPRNMCRDLGQACRRKTSEHLVVFTANLFHELVHFRGRDQVVPQHPREDLDRGLELFRDHFVRTEGMEGFDLADKPGPDKDVNLRIQ